MVLISNAPMGASGLIRSSGIRPPLGITIIITIIIGLLETIFSVWERVVFNGVAPGERHQKLACGAWIRAQAKNPNATWVSSLLPMRWRRFTSRATLCRLGELWFRYKTAIMDIAPNLPAVHAVANGQHMSTSMYNEKMQTIAFYAAAKQTATYEQ